MASAKNDFIVSGTNSKALFSLKVFRGDGMTLLGMNWKTGKPPKNFVGFSFEYKEPDGHAFLPLPNKLSFKDKDGKVKKGFSSTLIAPIQKFRWVHFPQNAEKEGLFSYKVKPVFMNEDEELSYGESQQVEIALMRTTYSKKLNVTFTRGFVSSQAFARKFGNLSTLIPPNAKEGLTFTPTHPKADEALTWMGFEARKEILDLLDTAIADKKAKVRAICYDLSMPEIVSRFKKLKSRLQIIIDNSKDHKDDDASESVAADELEASGATVKRHHMSNLQHNKTIIVDSPTFKAVLCGSTNFSWRGFYVQSNNALFLYGKKAITPFIEAFDNYIQFDSVKEYGKTESVLWHDLGLTGINAKVTFSPHGKDNAVLKEIAVDVDTKVKSNVIYSLAFLSQTTGPLTDAIATVTNKTNIFAAGISDRKASGIIVHRPDGNAAPVFITELSENLPEPFISEPSGLSNGKGTRMHHKFIVIDFDKPTARVYMGSYNFSKPADVENGENLLLIEDQKVAVSYMIEGVRLFDHYEFRVAFKEAKKKKEIFSLAKPPKAPAEKAWWEKYYDNPRRKKDRELFS